MADIPSQKRSRVVTLTQH